MRPGLSLAYARVPAKAYYGAQPARAVEHFAASGLRFSRGCIRALGLIKKHAAATNAELGLLDARCLPAIREPVLAALGEPLVRAPCVPHYLASAARANS